MKLSLYYPQHKQKQIPGGILQKLAFRNISQNSQESICVLEYLWRLFLHIQIYVKETSKFWENIWRVKVAIFANSSAIDAW